MLLLKKTSRHRKMLVDRLEELLGVKSVYTRVPQCAYDIGTYRVDKDGNLLIPEEDVDIEVLETLFEEGLIGGLPKFVKKTIEVAPSLTPTEIRFVLPMEDHTGISLRNLINLLYSRASLINKATGSKFLVKEGLIETLQKVEQDATAKDVLQRIMDYEMKHGTALEGLGFTEDRICFTGFPDSEDSDIINACVELVSCMNKQAISLKRILAKKANEENEKYSFRVWLIRLGMKGEKYKETRKILLKNLSGNGAFRTTEGEEKAKRKRQKQE